MFFYNRILRNISHFLYQVSINNRRQHWSVSLGNLLHGGITCNYKRPKNPFLQTLQYQLILTLTNDIFKLTTQFFSPGICR